MTSVGSPAQEAPEHDQTLASTTRANMIFRRLLVWLCIAIVSAVPSFFLAIISGHQNWPAYLAMVLGIIFFSFMFAVVSTCDWFRDQLERPFVRRAMQIGFGLRILASIVVVPVGIMADMLPGLLATQFGESLSQFTGFPPDGFVVTFWQTLIQGSILNAEVLLVVAAAWIFQIAFLTWRPRSPHGCVRCGYDLGHSANQPGAVCPECGSTAGPAGERIEWVDRIGLTRLAITLGAGLLVMMTLQAGIGLLVAL